MTNTRKLAIYAIVEVIALANFILGIWLFPSAGVIGGAASAIGAIIIVRLIERWNNEAVVDSDTHSSKSCGHPYHSTGQCSETMPPEGYGSV